MARWLMKWPVAHAARSDPTAVPYGFLEEHYVLEGSQPKSPQKTPYSSDTLTVGNLAWNDVSSNRGLCCEKPATNRFL
jgi:hypothetical protein